MKRREAGREEEVEKTVDCGFSGEEEVEKTVDCGFSAM